MPKFNRQFIRRLPRNSAVPAYRRVFFPSNRILNQRPARRPAAFSSKEGLSWASCGWQDDRCRRCRYLLCELFDAV